MCRGVQALKRSREIASGRVETKKGLRFPSCHFSYRGPRFFWGTTSPLVPVSPPRRGYRSTGNVFRVATLETRALLFRSKTFSRFRPSGGLRSLLAKANRLHLAPDFGHYDVRLGGMPRSAFGNIVLRNPCTNQTWVEDCLRPFRHG